jgi:hypothetical protein
MGSRSTSPRLSVRTLGPMSFRGFGIRVHGEKVFEIRWDNAGGFKVIHYDPGDGERTLRGWPAPIPM